MTYSGYTAFMLASNRPKADIHIFTSNKNLLNTLSLVWGVDVYFYDKFVSTDESIDDIIEILKNEKVVEIGVRITAIKSHLQPLKRKSTKKVTMVLMSLEHLWII